MQLLVYLIIILFCLDITEAFLLCSPLLIIKRRKYDVKQRIFHSSRENDNILCTQDCCFYGR